MIVACRACKAPMQLEEPSAGEKFRCPTCGEEFAFQPPSAARVQDAAATGVRAAVPAPAPRPTGGLPPADGPEVEILMLRPSIARGNPLLFLLLVVVLLVGLAGAAWVGVQGGSDWALYACLGGAGVALIGLAWLKVASLGSRVRITSKRVVDMDGLFSRRISEVLHRDIRNIRVDQTVAQRLLNTGDFSIFTAAEGEPEVYMANVPNPGRVREVIDAYRIM
ncbi:MAG TPA: PH domain-containing protein [Phycisphaerales bacterium]|nr:PH domain-containing protein [Phycisphaerales bacterium]